MSASVMYVKACIPNKMLLYNILLFIFLYRGVIGQSASYVPTDPTVHCSEGWYQFRDRCYLASGRNHYVFVTWDVARERCIDMGADLASVHSKEEQEFLITFLLLNIDASLWIGLNDKEKSGHNVWTDGLPFDFENWNNNEPTVNNDDSKENCVHMIFNAYLSHEMGKWNNLPCDHRSSYLCETAADPAISNPNPKYCHDSDGGGYKLKSSCLHYVSTPMTWSAAEEFCETRYDGHLVAVRDYTVHKFLDYILKEMKASSPLWIGLKAVTKKSPQYWSSGWHVVFDRWTDGFSRSQLRDGACVSRQRSGFWEVRQCERKYSFVCEVSTIEAPKLEPTVEGSYCPTDFPVWKDLGGDYCYSFNTESDFTWHEANFECIRNGGTLTGIYSREELYSIEQFIRYQSRPYYHIGLHRKNDDRLYWLDGSPVSYQFWQVGEPSSKTELCMDLRADTMDWNDNVCVIKLAHICSVKKIPPNVTLSEEFIGCSGELLIIQ